MNNKDFTDYITFSSILMLLGFIILIAGIYYFINGGVSSGVTMGKNGHSYGTGTLDGKGMTFCGMLLFGFGFVLCDTPNKTPKKSKRKRK